METWHILIPRTVIAALSPREHRRAARFMQSRPEPSATSTAPSHETSRGSPRNYIVRGERRVTENRKQIIVSSSKV